MLKKTAWLLAGSTIALGIATHVAAATAAAPATVPAVDTVQEVVVTAQRHEESVNKVGMAIQAFKGADLARLHVSSTSELSTVAPSFNVSQGYQGVPIYTMRGVGFNTINLSATSTVGTYTDEVAYAYPFMNSGPLFDLQRVEVLKGPQGTLYGRNTTAGLLDFITNKPTDAFGASLTAEVGNYGAHNFEGYVNGPLGGKAQARIAFRTDDSDEGWQKSDSSGARLGQVHRYGGRAALAIEPTSKLKIDLSLSGWYNGSDTLAAQAIAFTPATNPATAGKFGPFNAPGLAAFIAAHASTSDTQADWTPAARRQSDIGTGLGISGPLTDNDQFYAGKARIAYDLTDSVKLVSLTGYNALNRDDKADWSGAPDEILAQHYSGTIRSISEDLHFEGDTRLGHWLVGGYFGKDSVHDGDRTLLGQNANSTALRFIELHGGAGGIPAGGFFPPSPLAALNTFGYTPLQVAQAFRTYADFGDISTTTASLFASADWKLTDRLKLTTGLRYTQDDERFAGCTYAYDNNILPVYNLFNRVAYRAAYHEPAMAAAIQPGGCVSFNPAANSFGLIRESLNENNVAGRVSLDWTPISGTLVYASVSRGAKAGDIPILAANIATQELPAKQEMITAYEVGTKASLFDRHAQVNASVFYYDYQDKQLQSFIKDPVYTALQRLVNVPKSDAYGVDGDVTWRLTHDLTVMASATYLQTEIKDFVGVNAAGLPQNYSGDQFPNSPTWQGSATLLYSHPLTDKLGFQAALNGRFQSRSHADLGVDPDYAIKGYGLLNASVGLNSLNDRWAFSLWGRNLTNTYYWTSVANNANTVVRFPGQPLTFGASLTVKY